MFETRNGETKLEVKENEELKISFSLFGGLVSTEKPIKNKVAKLSPWFCPFCRTIELSVCLQLVAG